MFNVTVESVEGRVGRVESRVASYNITKSRACHARWHSYNSPRLPRNLHVVSCHHLTALTVKFAKNTQHDTSKVLRLPREVNMNTSKVLRLPRKMELIFWKPCKSIAPVTQNDLRHSCRHVRMSRSATPAMQNDITTYNSLHFWNLQKWRVLTFPHKHGDATRKPHVVATKSSFPNETPNLLPQNWCLVWGFRQFSSPVTILHACHACHAICTCDWQKHTARDDRGFQVLRNLKKWPLFLQSL